MMDTIHVSPKQKLNSMVRRCFLLLMFLSFMFIIAGITLLVHKKFVPSYMFNDYQWFDSILEGSVDNYSCRLPNLDPFYPSVLEFVENKTINCMSNTGSGYINNFKIDGNWSFLRIEPKTCCYLLFPSVARIRRKLQMYQNNCTPVDVQLPPEAELVAIYCRKNRAGVPIIVDLLQFTPIKPAVEERALKLLARKRLDASLIPIRIPPQVNVVIFGMDSLSHMQFLRVMPLTRNYLVDFMGAVFLNGYSRVGDNTFPNIIPVLTGLNVTELSRLCWPTRYTHFDDCPFIWKDYREAGYRTAYSEDSIPIAIFNHEAYGFRKQPTDYFLNDFMNTLAVRFGHFPLSTGTVCYGQRPAFHILLENMVKLAVRMGQSRPYFHFTWATSISHDDPNYAGAGDSDMLETLQFLHRNGHLNNTILILMSDHGTRTGKIRVTLQGRIENNMPYLYVVFPSWFKSTYPFAVHNFKKNQQKLSTPFDLHETLKDLLNLSSIQDQEIQTRQTNLNLYGPSRGISLFLSISKTRTCETASIPESYCTCHSMNTISVGSPGVHDSAHEAVATLNLVLAPERQCSQLRLASVVSVQNVEVDKSSAYGIRDIRPLHYVLLFRTEPGGAVFEAIAISKTLKPNTNNTRAWSIKTEISRVNPYRNESWCVHGQLLKKYCYCVV